MSDILDLTDPAERQHASLLMIGGIAAVTKIVYDLLEDFEVEDFEALREEPNGRLLTAHLREQLNEVADWAERQIDIIDQVDALLDEEDAA